MSIFRTFTVFILCFATSGAIAGPRLDAIKARGTLNCGVAIAEPGMSAQDQSGNTIGFEPDICRAIAAAIFGAPNVSFSPTVTLNAFLQSDDVDLVIRGLTRSFRRDVSGGVHFGPTIMHNGQTFLVRSELGAESFADLSGRTICVSSDVYADFYPPLQRYFDVHGLAFDGIGTQTRAESEALFFAGECDAVTADYAELASAIIKHADVAADFMILPGHIEEEPLAPLLRKGDDELYSIVSWAIYALINAEALGIDSKNVDAMRASTDTDVTSFFQEPPPNSGFHRDWSYAIIRSVGNYEEMFMRHLGAPGAANLPRGPNLLWIEGGLLYAPPIR
ncbi:MAG: transporter substrate-binding domain-containing protein [Micropepsaceae bacterium]